MNNPRIIAVVIEGASYALPIYQVTNEGIVDAGTMQIDFCKGNKQDEATFRQQGVFVESLIQLAKQHLECVNVGDLASRETSLAITKLEESLMWLNKRAEDRKLRGVQGTYQK